MSLGALSTIELTLLNITEKKHGVTWKTRKRIKWLPKKESLVLMSSIARATIKWIALAVLIGITISIKTGMVENNRSSFISRVQ